MPELVQKRGQYPNSAAMIIMCISMLYIVVVTLNRRPIRSKEPAPTTNLTVMKQKIIPFGLYGGTECLILHLIAWFVPVNNDM